MSDPFDPRVNQPPRAFDLIGPEFDEEIPWDCDLQWPESLADDDED